MDETVTKSTPNEWKKGWLIVLSAFCISFITDGLVFSFGIMFVEIVEHFGTTRATSSGIATLLAATQYAVGPLASALAEKYGYRIIVIIGSVVSCGGFILSSFATNIYHLWIAYGFMGGLGFGLLYLPAYAYVLQNFNHHRTLAVGITVSGTGIGTFVFNYCLRLLIDHYGWRGTMLLEAGIMLQGVVFGLLLTKSKTKNVKCEPTDEPTSFVTRVKSFFFSVFNPQLLMDMKCMMYMFAVLFIAVACHVPFNYLPDQVEQEGMTKTQAAMLMSTIRIANTIFRVIFSWIADRVCVSRFTLLITVNIFAGVVSGLSPWMSTFETKIVFTSLIGTFIGGCTTLMYGVVPEIVKPELVSNAFGLFLFFCGLSVVAGTPIAGYLFDLTGSYTITFIVCGAEFIVGAILFSYVNYCTLERKSKLLKVLRCKQCIFNFTQMFFIICRVIIVCDVVYVFRLCSAI